MLPIQKEDPMGHHLGIEIEGGFFHGADDDIRREHTVQAPEESFYRDGSGGMKIGDLTQRVHTGIGPAGADQLHTLLGHNGEVLCQNLLNGYSIRLDLPPMIIRAIILDEKLDVAHRTKSGRLILTFSRR